MQYRAFRFLNERYNVKGYAPIYKTKKCIVKKLMPIPLILCLFCTGCAQEKKGISGSIDFIAPDLYKLIGKDAKVEVLADGFQFTEGPVWVEKEQLLLLSDIPANAIYKWSEATGKTLYLSNAGYTESAGRGGFMGPNGLLIARDGSLVICQHGDRRIAAMKAPLAAPKQTFQTIAGRYDGRRFNSPNDLCMAPNGDLYFTDPSYGLEKGSDDPKREIKFQGVYKTDTTGKVSLLIDSIEAPNGIAVFPDGKTLLVANSDSRKKRWYTYTITPEGSLTDARIFFDVSDQQEGGVCDGLKIDGQGNVFATGPGGVWIFNRDGTLLGRIKVNGSDVTNCALTPDGKTLYLTATNYLLRVKMR